MPGCQGHVALETRLPINQVVRGVAGPVAGVALGAGALWLAQELEGEKGPGVEAAATDRRLWQAEQRPGFPLGEGAQLHWWLRSTTQVARAGRSRRQGPLAATHAAAAVVQRVLPRLRSLQRSAARPRPIGVSAAAQTAAAATPAATAALAPKDTHEGALELLAGARVDDGVEAAVEVAQPEHHLEHGVRGLQGGEQGTCRGADRKTVVDQYALFFAALLNSAWWQFPHTHALSQVIFYPCKLAFSSFN